MKNVLFIEELKAHKKVFVACSAGLDSTVLLDFLHRNGVLTHALHCNFQLRAVESDDDEIFIKHFCNKRGIPIDTKGFNTKSLKKNSRQSIQQLARDLRYSWFDAMLQTYEDSLLCTAHHLDDHEEQVWLRLLASGRILDLGGILAQRDSIRRPLLNTTKDELLAYAQFHSLSWREDASNATNDYTRNKIRNALKPILNSIDPRNRSAALKLASEVQKMRLESLEILHKKFGSSLYKSEFFVSSDFWEQQLSVVKEVLLEAWRGSNAQLYEIERFYKNAQYGNCLNLAAGFYLLRENDGLWFGCEPADEFKPIEIDCVHSENNVFYEIYQTENKTAKILHTLEIGDKISVAKISTGETFHFPDGKSRKLKKLFNDLSWKHFERKKALGWYLNGKLIGIIKPFEDSTLELVIKSNVELIKIIKFMK